MLSISHIKSGSLIKVSDEPYLVIKAGRHKMARGGAILKVKLKNLITGNILDKTWQGNEKIEQAETSRKKASFMYSDKNEVYFMDSKTYEQFSIAIDQIAEKQKFLKEGIEVDILYFTGKPVAIDLPVKIELKVINAPPGVKGNSAGSVTKLIELETGLKINAPLFINENDIIRINTETGEYVERA